MSKQEVWKVEVSCVSCKHQMSFNGESYKEAAEKAKKCEACGAENVHHRISRKRSSL